MQVTASGNSEFGRGKCRQVSKNTVNLVPSWEEKPLRKKECVQEVPKGIALLGFDGGVACARKNRPNFALPGWVLEEEPPEEENGLKIFDCTERKGDFLDPLEHWIGVYGHGEWREPAPVAIGSASHAHPPSGDQEST